MLLIHIELLTWYC